MDFDYSKETEIRIFPSCDYNNSIKSILSRYINLFNDFFLYISELATEIDINNIIKNSNSRCSEFNVLQI